MQILPLIAATLIGGFEVEETRVTHPELGFSLVVPAGFIEDPEFLAEPDVVYSWYEPRAEEEGTIVFLVQRLRYVLGRERLTEEDLPDPSMELMFFPWRQLEVPGVKEIPEDFGGEVVLFMVQVPLRREAIQLIISAPIEEAERARELLVSTLASVEGETNWLTRAERAERLGETAGRLLAIPLGILTFVWIRRRKQRAAAAAAAAAAMALAGAPGAAR